MKSFRRLVPFAAFGLLTASTCDSNVGDGDSRPAETVRLSLRATGEAGAGLCEHPSISSDGRYVVFDSAAEDLVTPDGNGYRDLFLKDRATGELRNLTRIPLSVIRPGGSQPLTNFLNHAFRPVVSADGRVVAFLSQGAFAPPHASQTAFPIVQVLDRSTGVYRRVFDVPGGGADRECTDLTISDDGLTLAFITAASNLGYANPGLIPQVYAVDLGVEPPALTLVSRAQASATTIADTACSAARLSRDGKTVVFHSRATNLAGLAGNEKIYLASPTGAAVELVSGIQGAPSPPAGGTHFLPAVSGDGRYVAFYAAASNITGTPDPLTKLVRVDRGVAGVVAPSVAFVADDMYDGSFPGLPLGHPLAISDDGRVVVYTDRLNPNQVRVRDMAGGGTLASLSASGVPGELPSVLPALSGDGRWVVWQTSAETLVEGDSNLSSDIYVRGPLR